MKSLGFIFPGQGSQSVGMIGDLLKEHQVVKETVEQASTALGFDLGQLIAEGPKEDLNRTDNTQPALLAASVALFRLWQQQSQVMPSVLAGHSLGEYSALVCSGAMDFTDAVKLVAQRGKFMMQAVPVGTGAMAAILGLDDQLVEQACQQASVKQIVAPVNYNSPGQLVIAGNKEAVELAIILCKTAGAKRALPLPVSVPSHCSLMKPAATQLSAALKNIRMSRPDIPVINNVDVLVESSSAQITDALVRQLYNPVRWSDTIQSMKSSGISTIVECGPGKVLTGLCKRIDRSIVALSTSDQANFNQSLEILN